MARPKSTTRSVHTTVRLPEALHRKLADAVHVSLAEEIKLRLEASLEWDPVDWQTKDFIAVVVELASLMAEDGKDWHSNPYNRAAFASAIVEWLGDRVRGEPLRADAKPAAGTSTFWMEKGADPAVAGGRLLALQCWFTPPPAPRENGLWPVRSRPTPRPLFGGDNTSGVFRRGSRKRETEGDTE